MAPSPDISTIDCVYYCFTYPNDLAIKSSFNTIYVNIFTDMDGLFTDSMKQKVADDASTYIINMVINEVEAAATDTVTADKPIIGQIIRKASFGITISSHLSKNVSWLTKLSILLAMKATVSSNQMQLNIIIQLTNVYFLANISYLNWMEFSSTPIATAVTPGTMMNTMQVVTMLSNALTQAARGTGGNPPGAGMGTASGTATWV